MVPTLPLERAVAASSPNLSDNSPSSAIEAVRPVAAPITELAKTEIGQFELNFAELHFGRQRWGAQGAIQLISEFASEFPCNAVQKWQLMHMSFYKMNSGELGS